MKIVDGVLLPLSDAEVASRVSSMSIPATAKKLLLSYVGKVRYAKETNGMTIDGLFVNTSREAQAQLTGAYNHAMADSSVTIKWKSGDSFVTLTATQIIAIALQVARHVEMCFSAEADVVMALNANPPTITSKTEIDQVFKDL